MNIKQTFLIAYDYGTGGLWGVMTARSAAYGIGRGGRFTPSKGGGQDMQLGLSRSRAWALVLTAAGITLMSWILIEVWAEPFLLTGGSLFGLELASEPIVARVLVIWVVITAVIAGIACFRLRRPGSRPSMHLAGWTMIVVGVIAFWGVPAGVVIDKPLYDAFPDASHDVSVLRVCLLAFSLLAPAGLLVLLSRRTLLRYPAGNQSSIPKE